MYAMLMWGQVPCRPDFGWPMARHTLSLAGPTNWEEFTELESSVTLR